ncbi:hypothetical protein [Azospirillum canadense]|uniref:hypothetical protein n=1 Tax=Azospirillum canadense TaxID=403962 RepID=UPI0022265D08|nr:hypothetical protein [Azospirillum canadense]MCW2239972.1 hypothetical protein [Azospirillum canadense]
MQRRGDAVGDQLAVGVQQRDVGREMHARAWHQLPFEGVAVQVNDARQQEQPAGLDHAAGWRVVADLNDAAVGDGDPGLDEDAVRRQDACAADVGVQSAFLSMHSLVHGTALNAGTGRCGMKV